VITFNLRLRILSACSIAKRDAFQCNRTMCWSPQGRPRGERCQCASDSALRNELNTWSNRSVQASHSQGLSLSAVKTIWTYHVPKTKEEHWCRSSARIALLYDLEDRVQIPASHAHQDDGMSSLTDDIRQLLSLRLGTRLITSVRGERVQRFRDDLVDPVNLAFCHQSVPGLQSSMRLDMYKADVMYYGWSLFDI
jgi:hypothetical protein